LPRALRITIPLENSLPQTVDALHSLCSERKGDAKLLFYLERTDDYTVVMEVDGYNVHADQVFIGRARELCGRNSVSTLD
jgi:hypothetical protein